MNHIGTYISTGMSKLSFSWRRFGALWNALELNKCSLLMNEIDRTNGTTTTVVGCTILLCKWRYDQQRGKCNLKGLCYEDLVALDQFFAKIVT